MVEKGSWGTGLPSQALEEAVKRTTKFILGKTKSNLSEDK